MQHLPSTVEEQLFLKAIRDESTWENLPKRLQSMFASKEEWHKRVMHHCICKRLQWNTCFARKICREGEYYEEMLRYLRKNLALFPYHLAEYVCRVMRISPFRYYCDMLFEVMKNEQPYDSIPNFGAADALRVSGIGRNEFIDIMNKCRSKKIMWKLNKSIAKDLLPVQPVDFSIEPWWGVCLVNFTLDEFKRLTEEEAAVIDKICKEEANLFALFDPNIIRGLHRRGLVYFDVPVYPDDRFKVSRLEGFVSNREQSYEDPIKELLYAVFVVSSENATVAELAATLQADLSQLQAAASFACRLGWAVKVIDPASYIQDSVLGPSVPLIDDDEGVSCTSCVNAASDVSSLDGSSPDNRKATSGHISLAFLVDANITSYLMMGSLSPGLKTHAVTLYEAGKLGDASIRELCKDLKAFEGHKFEGELQEFANHAISLRLILECFHSGGVGSDELIAEASSRDASKPPSMPGSGDASTLPPSGIDEDQHKLEPSMINLAEPIASERKSNVSAIPDQESGGVNFNLQLGTATLGVDSSGSSSIHSREETPSENENGEGNSAGPVAGEEKSIASTVHGQESPGVNFNLGQSEAVLLAADSSGTNPIYSREETPSKNQNGQDDDNSWSFDVPKTAITEKPKMKYVVNLLRCESLAALAPTTLDKLFRRDYGIVVSMIPLPFASVLPGPAGPFHLGPPSYSSMTPWMKLVLYMTAGSGPLSVILMKGQSLRLLPAPLAGCERALIWSWDGSAVGGLGGNFDGNLVQGSILLHCVNSLLKHSAVLVQPFGKYDLDNSGKAITIDIPLPFKNFDGSIPYLSGDMGLSPEESTKVNSLLDDLSSKIELQTTGYIRLLRLYKGGGSGTLQYEWVPLSLELGIPLFSPKLCRSICERIVSSQLLQMDSFLKHHMEMLKLQRRVKEICIEYNSSGPTTKLFYQPEQLTEPSHQLMSFASGRWNPLINPSSPITDATSEHQRLKLACRNRCRSEVLSFDGSILRSYALTPVYEAATRPFEEGASVTAKAESDDYDSKEVMLPGINLLFDGSQLNPFDIGTCLQAHPLAFLIAEASAASVSLQTCERDNLP